MTIFVTGGAGFIGSALVRYLIKNTRSSVVLLDKLTYAGNLESLAEVDRSDRYKFEKVDICDPPKMDALFHKFRPDAVIHLAAESHVDRSIEGPSKFVETNIVGTYQLLESTRKFIATLPAQRSAQFRFLHVSTDEVFGDLVDTDSLFTECTPYAPSSPYAATKAGSDHLVRAWHRTFEVPTLITNCSNNYGPYQFPEKLIPHMILNALEGKDLPVYGQGNQIRDWLYVDDHARAIWMVLNDGKVGETYNVGGHNEHRNIDVVHRICGILQKLIPGSNTFEKLIKHVADRPGHDVRYAIDASKISDELGWTPLETFETGLEKTVCWYLENRTWWSRVLNGSYQLQRLGVAEKTQ